MKNVADLGLLANAVNSMATRTNETGTAIVGIVHRQLPNRPPGYVTSGTAFLRAGSTINDLPEAFPGAGAIAYGVNSASPVKVVGEMSDDAVLWSGNSFTILRSQLGGFWSGARDINDTDVVVGWATAGPAPSDSYKRAFVLNSSTGALHKDLVLPGGLYSMARAVNQSGVVVGGSHFSGSQPGDDDAWACQHAFVFINKNLMDLDTGDLTSIAYDINDTNVIAGVAGYGRGHNASFSLGHGCTWTPDGTAFLMTDIHDASFGFDASQAMGINNAGEIVGNGYDSRSSDFRIRAVYWPAGGATMQDINTWQFRNAAVGDNGWHFWHAFAIDNVGRIAGVGEFNNDGKWRAVVIWDDADPLP